MDSSAATKELVRKYYDGLSKKTDWGHLLSDNFLLTGTIAKESRGRDAYVNNQFFKLVRGLTVKEMAIEGEKAFALVNYSLVSPKGKSFSSDVGEFWKGDHKYNCWIRVAGAEKNLAIAFHPIVDSTPVQRKKRESNLVRKLQPLCADPSRVLGPF